MFQQIDEITVRSNFFHSDVSKLVSITIRDIRVNKDINETSHVEPVINLPTSPNDGEQLQIFDFRNKKVPPSIIKFAQVYLIGHLLYDLCLRQFKCYSIYFSSCRLIYKISQW